MNFQMGFLSFIAYYGIGAATLIVFKHFLNPPKEVFRKLLHGVGLAMLCSGLAMLVIGLMRFSSPKVSGSVVMGLVIAGLGLATNGYFWWRYSQLNRQSHNLVIASQQRLYRAKTRWNLSAL